MKNVMNRANKHEKCYEKKKIEIIKTSKPSSSTSNKIQLKSRIQIFRIK